MITKILVYGAVAIGAAIGLAAPAGADPSFTQLNCSCEPPAADHGPAVEEHVNRGLEDARTR